MSARPPAVRSLSRQSYSEYASENVLRVSPRASLGSTWGSTIWSTASSIGLRFANVAASPGQAFVNST